MSADTRIDAGPDARTDARTGRRIWTYRDDGSSSQRVNRGAALLGDRVFFVTSDARLVSISGRRNAAYFGDSSSVSGNGSNRGSA